MLKATNNFSISNFIYLCRRNFIHLVGAQRIKMEFQKLPEEIIISVTNFLDGFDIVRLSNTSRHLRMIFNYDTFWRNLMRRDGLNEDELLSKIADREADYASITNTMKLEYILHKKADSNWMSGQYSTAYKKLGKSKVALDDNHFVALRSSNNYVGMLQNQMSYLTGGRVSGQRTPPIDYSLSVYDLRKPGLDSVIHEELRLFQWISLRPFMTYSEITHIFLWKNILVVAFGCENELHKLIALDITDGLKEVWAALNDKSVRKSQGPHLDTTVNEHIKLFADKLFRIRFFAELIIIEIRNICDHQLEKTLLMLRHFEFNGEDAASDGTYFVMTGRLSDRNTPCLVGWVIETNINKLYVSDQPLCPYRSFYKAACCEGKVYGLLDRRSLYIWNADTCELLNTVILSEGQPGLQCVDYILAMNKDVTPPFLVTVNQSLQMLTILDRDGNISQELGWSDLSCPCPNDNAVVLDVHILKSFMLVQFMDYSIRTIFWIRLPLPLGKYKNQRSNFSQG